MTASPAPSLSANFSARPPRVQRLAQYATNIVKYVFNRGADLPVAMVITSSQQSFKTLKVFSPICLTATPSANSPTCESTIALRFHRRIKTSGVFRPTPITLISGRTYLMYAAIPAAKPPPPTGMNIASTGRVTCRNNSTATVP